MATTHPSSPRLLSYLLAGLGLAFVLMFGLASARPAPDPADEAPLSPVPTAPQVRPEIAVFLATYPEFGRPAEILPPPDPSNPSLHALRTDRGRVLHFLLSGRSLPSVSELDPSTGLSSPLPADSIR